MGYEENCDELIGLNLEEAIEIEKKEGYVWKPTNERRNEKGELETMLTYPNTKDVVIIRSVPDNETRTFKVVEAWATNEFCPIFF